MIYRFGEFELDRERYRLLRDGETVHIEPLALDLVVHLIEHRDRVVSKEELLETLWTDRFVSDAVLARCVHEARHSLCDDSEQQRFIQTVRGRGYGFGAEVEESADGEGPTPADDEEPLPWEPAIGAVVPNRPNWVLERKLADGGFGSVWLASHRKTHAKRTFKFCFDKDRLHGLEREVVLFRLLQASLGERDDITRVLDWHFEEVPYFLETAYTPGGDLVEWSESQGGIAQVPLAVRLELVAQVAVALAAAHSAGVLHKDIKPSNILITEHPESHKPRASLTDFGIGLLTDRELLRDKGITAAGLTETLLGDRSGTSGTRLYMAPEVLEGRAPTIQSDLYALGVVLYQSLRGDFSSALAPGWEREIDDEVLRDDIAACVDGEPERRLGGAAELADRIRRLVVRRRTRAAAARSQRRRRQLAIASLAGMTLTLLVAVVAWRESRLRQQAESAQYVSVMQIAGVHLANRRRAQAREALLEAPAKERGWEWGALVNEAWPVSQQKSRQVADLPPGASAADIWRGATATVVATAKQPSGSLILLDDTGDRLVYNTASGIRILDLETATIQARLPVMPADWPVALSHDGLLASTGTDFTLWDPETEQKVESLQRQHLGLVLAASFSRDGAYLATWSPGVLRVFATESRQLLWRSTLERREGGLFPDLRFAADGSRLVATIDGNAIATWSVASGQRLSTVAGPAEDDLAALRISPNTDRVLSLGSNRLVLWNTTTCEVVQVVEPRPGEALLRPGSMDFFDLWRTAFSADSTALAVLGPAGSLRLLDARNGETLTVLRVVDSDAAVAWSGDGTRIAASELDGSIKVLAPGIHQPAHSLLSGHRDAVRRVTWSRDSSRLVTLSYDGTVAVWDMKTGTKATVLRHPQSPPLEVEISPNGRLVWTRDWDGIQRVWETASGEERFELEDQRSGAASGGPGPRADIVLFGGAFTPPSLPWSPDGEHLLLERSQGTTAVVETSSSSGAIPFDVIGLHATYSPDGRHILSRARFDTELKVSNAANGELLYTLENPDCCGFARLEVSPDSSRFLAASPGGVVRVWDLASGALELELAPHAGNAILAHFSPNGRRILTASFDRTAKLWDARTGELLATLRGPDALSNAAFSPDGRRVFTLFRHHSSLQIWDLAGNQLTTLSTDSPIVNVAWSPDGKTLAASQLDGGVRLWKTIPWAELEAIGNDAVSFAERLRRWREAQ